MARNETNIVKPKHLRASVAVPNIADSMGIDMTPSSFKVWMCMYAMGGDVLPRKLSSDNMGKLLGLSSKTVKRAKEELVGRGIAETKKTSRTAVSLILLDELWPENAAAAGLPPNTDTMKFFFRIPRTVLLDPELTPTDFRIWCHVKRVCGDAGAFFEHPTTTAANTGVGLRQVKEAVRTLVSCGYIEKDSDGRYTVPPVKTDTFDSLMKEALTRSNSKMSQVSDSEMSQVCSEMSQVSDLGQNGNLGHFGTGQNGNLGHFGTGQNGNLGHFGTTEAPNLGHFGTHNNKEFNNKELAKKSLSNCNPIVTEQGSGVVVKERETEPECISFGRTIPKDDGGTAADVERWRRMLDLCGLFLVERNGADADAAIDEAWLKKNAEKMLRPASHILSQFGYDQEAAWAAVKDVRERQLGRGFNASTLDYIWPDVKVVAEKAAITKATGGGLNHYSDADLAGVRERTDKAMTSAKKARELARVRLAGAARICELVGIPSECAKSFMGILGIAHIDALGDRLSAMSPGEFAATLTQGLLVEYASRGVDIELQM